MGVLQICQQTCDLVQSLSSLGCFLIKCCVKLIYAIFSITPPSQAHHRHSTLIWVLVRRNKTGVILPVCLALLMCVHVGADVVWEDS